jgi:hypothetical protein
MNPLPALGIASVVGLGRSVTGLASQSASGFADLLRTAVRANPENGATSKSAAAADSATGPGSASGSANGGGSTAATNRFGPSGVAQGSGSGAADRLQHTVRDATRRVQDRIRDLLAANGIDLRSPVRLHVAGDGAVRVDGSHPQRAQIESLLGGDPDLRSELASLGRLVQQSRLLAQSANLRAHYERDPDGTAATLEAFAGADTSGFDVTVGPVGT